MPVAEAIEIFQAQGQDYKVELIEDLVRDEGVETVSLYRNGPFEDLCRGPHGPSTGRIKAIKLNSVAGAYWRGDENRQMLTRIYGTAFFSKKDLDAHLERIEEAKARDHRRLGPQLGLFMLREEAPGHAVLAAQRDHAAAPDRGRGAEAARQARLRRRSSTPQVLDERALAPLRPLGQLPREHVLHRGSSERRFALRPMNCPGACLVFGADRHSYRELPLRLAEFGQVSRYEREGVLHGLLRVRAFTQDDAHVYCTPEQIADEVAAICEAIDELYARFGFEDVRVELSTRPEKSIGTDEQWEQAEAALGEALEQPGPRVRAQPRRRRLLRAEDRLPRHRRARPLLAVRHLPARLLHARALRPHLHRPDDEQRRPVMIHRALLGSMERFAGILIEHYAGRFPAWLAPVQAIVLPVADRHADYAQQVAEQLRELGVRVAVDDRSESIGRKIRDAELGRYPYMLVVGDREQEGGAVAVRSHDEGELGEMPARSSPLESRPRRRRLSAAACQPPVCLYTPPT